MASQSSGDTASGRAAPPVTSSPVFPESCDSAAASAFVSAAAAAVDALSVVAPSVGEPPPCSPQALRDKAIIPASAAARMRFAFVFFIILFSFLLLIVIYVHKPWGLRFFLCRVLSALLLTSVFSAEVQAVEDFIPAGHKGLR
jgi:hypothetical protein